LHANLSRFDLLALLDRGLALTFATRILARWRLSFREQALCSCGHTLSEHHAGPLAGSSGVSAGIKRPHFCRF
jgi:hypothetical protein